MRIFQQYFSYIVAVNYIGGGNRSAWKKNTGLPQVTDKLYHKVVHLAMSGISFRYQALFEGKIYISSFFFTKPQQNITCHPSYLFNS
jgi:hypothetical protein